MPKRIVALGATDHPEWDLEIHDGMFEIGGDPCCSDGHTWLMVEGSIFDPTASQFEGNMDSLFYRVHEICEGEDLFRRIAL